MESKVTRGERFLQKIVDDGLISDCGRDWLIAAIDPFHDKTLKHLEGWPDNEAGLSVVRCVKQSITVGRPSTVPATDNWDCHVVQWPWLSNSRLFQPTNQRQGNAFTFVEPAPTIQGLGGLQVFGMATNTNLNVLTSELIGTLGLSNTFSQGAGRCVGIGFEVHNTTAVIQQQGAACVYRQMSPSIRPQAMQGFSSSVGINPLTFSATQYRYPPLNTQQALLLPGTRQWEAKEGVYVVGAFNDINNPAYPVDQVAPIIMGTGLDDLDGVFNTNNFNFPVTGNGIVAGAQRNVPTLRCHPLHQSGAIFTGLSPLTTLVLNWNIYYEVFPGLANQVILPLASPSCEYDPDALDLYSRIVTDLPVGVRVRDNGLGDWFLGAVRDAATHFAPILKSIPHPVAQGAGFLADYIGKTAPSYVKVQPNNPWEDEGGIKNTESPQKGTGRRKNKNKPKKGNQGSNQAKARVPPK